MPEKICVSVGFRTVPFVCVWLDTLLALTPPLALTFCSHYFSGLVCILLSFLMATDFLWFYSSLVRSRFVLLFTLSFFGSLSSFFFVFEVVVL